MRRATLRLVLVLTLFALAACGGGGGGGSTEPPSGFVVTGSSPADGEQGVDVDSRVVVTFSRSLDADTVVSTTLRVGEIGGSGEVPGFTTFDAASPTVLVWTPAQVMREVWPHECRISSTLRSTEGESLDGDSTFAFRTGADTPPGDLPGPEDLRTLDGTLNVGRRSHTATHLGSGRVLITGGYSQSSNVSDRAEIYNQEVFSLLPATMEEERAQHTATLLGDGRVLLTGGLYEAAVGQLASTAGAEIWTPGSNSFAAVSDMSTERYDHAAVLLFDGRVLITGGSRLQGTSFVDLDSAEIFDPETNLFTPVPTAMTTTRAAHVALDVGGGRILLYGGSDVDLRPDVYDEVEGTFSPLLPPVGAAVRFSAAGAVFESGGASIAGGDDLGTVVHVAWPPERVTNTGSALSSPRSYATATRISSSRILVGGGADLSNGFFLLGSFDLIEEGGIGGSRTYGTTMRFPVGVALHTATPLGGGRVLFCGGLNPVDGLPNYTAAYLYDPADD